MLPGYINEKDIMSLYHYGADTPLLFSLTSVVFFIYVISNWLIEQIKKQHNGAHRPQSFTCS